MLQSFLPHLRLSKRTKINDSNLFSRKKATKGGGERTGGGGEQNLEKKEVVRESTNIGGERGVREKKKKGARHCFPSSRYSVAAEILEAPERNQDQQNSGAIRRGLEKRGPDDRNRCVRKCVW